MGEHIDTRGQKKRVNEHDDAKRRARTSFKQYLRQIEEDLLEAELEEDTTSDLHKQMVDKVWKEVDRRETGDGEEEATRADVEKWISDFTSNNENVTPDEVDADLFFDWFDH